MLLGEYEQVWRLEQRGTVEDNAVIPGANGLYLEGSDVRHIDLFARLVIGLVCSPGLSARDGDVAFCHGSFNVSFTSGAISAVEQVGSSFAGLDA